MPDPQIEKQTGLQHEVMGKFLHETLCLLSVVTPTHTNIPKPYNYKHNGCSTLRNCIGMIILSFLNLSNSYSTRTFNRFENLRVELSLNDLSLYTFHFNSPYQLLYMIECLSNKLLNISVECT